MGLIVWTTAPRDLVDAVKKRIEDGRIKTWSVDAEGDFTHTPTQWQRRAWMRPRIKVDRVVFSILGNKKFTMTKAVYAVYHGRFAEMLLEHLDTDFSKLEATAKKDAEDVFK